MSDLRMDGREREADGGSVPIPRAFIDQDHRGGLR